MPDTLPGLLARRAADHPDQVALREKEFGIWQEITWAGFLGRVRSFSLGLVELGLRNGDRIAIIGDNRPEWVIAELGAQSIGALPLGLYQDSISAELARMLEAADARLIVAEDQEQVDKVLEVRDRVPGLEHIVYYDSRGMYGYEAPGLMAFEEVERLGEAFGDGFPDEFDRRLSAIRPGDTALLCTTSGTTSVPKLAMLSHANLLAMAEQLVEVDPMEPGDEFVSFLPLAWIGEQMVGVASAMLAGFTVNFPEETATVRADIREIGPAFMMSPPRIWENMVSDVQVMAEDTTPLKRWLYRWAMREGMKAAEGRAGLPARLRHRLADWTVLLPIRDQLGLSRVRRAYTGGAALGPDVFRFFHAIGVNLKQLYGQTEVSGISVVHRDGDIRFHTVGLPFPETEIRISDEGEILCRSPAVFRGYFRNPEATAEALADGWLHSGDAGYFEDDGHLVVIDRLADVMKLPDGTAFSPQFVENKLKFSPYVREAVVFGGGGAPFVTTMIAIDMENAGQWAERHRVPYTTFTDLARREEVYALARDHVATINRDLPAAARIRRFLLLHKELHADDAELTRTRKVRRRHIAERFGEIIAALQGDGDSVTVSTEITYQDGRTAEVAHELRIETMEG
ncbi:MAG: long-chain fatty acid--CoA ligase [Gemmatimonadetes bacterium]|nr:long-chain fatty acid--CoA ligase [Gemmatimonadota bacterium]MYA63877.1 long-chain fatty acid--CoA ligase [Gemmatimonadota bacterium]MYB97776.1 long-chain fatty acid--CoA ligase [Gemmatimonadota bacterium]MYH52336.1 long-chain fatty acid--CoA ligase [Gemmatimonadota bacterium]MYK65877.1 long-chain fatty acid--CoA ligase [Gemmatimonadota bacterium]